MGDEHVLSAVVFERLAGEAGPERLQLETGDVDETEPLVLRCPPKRARSVSVQVDVDPIVSHRVPDGVRYGLMLVLAVETGREPVVERERVPCEPPARQE